MSSSDVTGTDPEIQDEAERRLWRRIAWRIIPIVGLAYLMSYIDRANLGYVAQPMSRELGLDAAQIGLAGGLFFIGYILVEVPSNMALRRFGARKWITRIMVTWGLITALTAYVDSAAHLYLARLALGFAEAGLAAGILLYLTFWFPRKVRSWVMATFFLMIPLSSIVGAPLAAALLSWGDILFPLSAWRSLFLVEGVLTLMVAVVVFCLLPDRPSDAKWLSDDDRARVEAALQADEEKRAASGAISGFGASMRSGRVWVLAIAFFTVVFGLYPLAFFLPTMISTISDAAGGDVNSVLVSAIPSAFAIIVMIMWSRVSGRLSAVTATVVPMAVGAAGLVLATAAGSGYLFVAAVCLSTAGIYSAMPQFWRIPPLALTGAAAAAGIAVINSVSNLSGFVGPYVTGAIHDATGSYTWALLTIAAVMVAGIGVVLTTGRRIETTMDR
ncbi:MULTISPECIES: MFS transporter [Pseudonocardia]|uniref:MFS transporter n=2 Tax=Pseudonocardia TaxID=1847 RepID=A0ABQ0RVT6_9PSEU|nr:MULTISPECIES: MFS transporter [Pseudonocardia]OSY38324.1 putative tartrate transporter [Pseudonocardia autotrophica]TDN72630.1 sugar phosphate permease [Pseudonocardia autotrophica]BBG03340.1 MFS transporter [Pseudonocardia autotrophica]GEC24598.1 MFS transporter [Pseudonocardia saturnea]